MVVAFHADMPMRFAEGALPPEMLLVNGSCASELLVEHGRPIGDVEADVINCCGETLSSAKRYLAAGLNRLAVPPAGHVHLRKTS